LNAQVKVNLSLQECESAFQKNNMLLLASRYGIDEKRALVLQAKKWDNPYFSAEFNAINPDAGRYLDVGNQGQKVFAIEQLIKLGGKIKNQVEIAKKHVNLAEAEYNDLIRNLQFSLRTSYYSAYYDLQTLSNIDKQLASLDTLIISYKKQVEKGNISLKDLVRLQALYLETQNEWTSLRNEIISEQENISAITGIDSLIIPLRDSIDLKNFQSKVDLTYDNLATLALTNRPDLKAHEEWLKIGEQNVKFQKANAAPDLTLGAIYDQRGGAFNNQVNVTLGIPLPIYNQNKAGIQAAKSAELSAKALMEQKSNEIKAEVQGVVRRYKITLENYQKLSTQILDNYDIISKSIFENFQKQNITLIEFTDFIESYTKSLVEINRVKKSLAIICEEINYITASKVF
jgi:cobalt-zinc-cadmium efflux system outer membrane protein